MAGPGTGLEARRRAGWGSRGCLWALAITFAASMGGYSVREAVAPCWPDHRVRTDPHSYHRNECSSDWTSSGAADTLAKALQFYRVPLPPSASDVHYYSDDGAFNGPSTLFLRFSVPASDLPAFLKAVAAAPTSTTAAQLTSGTGLSRSFVEGLGPEWTEGSTTGSTVYQWDEASGNVIVERHSTDMATVLVIAQMM